MTIDKWGRAMLAHMRLLHPVDVSRNSFSVLVSMREESQYVFAINEISILRLCSDVDLASDPCLCFGYCELDVSVLVARVA